MYLICEDVYLYLYSCVCVHISMHMYAHNVIIFSFFSCGGLGATKKSEFVQI